MKVVLFCGGLGTRLRDYSDQIPKPLVEIGSRPILWHVMRYYAHYGHTDFILCLGYKGDAIKKYFLTYDECVSNDFVFSGGGAKIDMIRKDIESWRITFVDTGLRSNIGERLRRVRKYVESEEVFLANYSDGVADLDCAAYVDSFLKSGKIGSFLSVRVPHTFHMVHADAEGYAVKLEAVASSPMRVNGGFFAFRREIFDYMRDGEELVVEPFQRLIEKRQLLAVAHDGFWRSMDTFRDKIELDELAARGKAPWQIWLP
ncbi:MAG TPA: sugar phosphate nucleotidyltransferase [Polyangiaceae bacterium]|nr:sugar phosphate nucleotidyltransferase [Polyangiaceae bacterium]